MIRAIDRIVHVERRRNGMADGFAIGDAHRAVRALGHDLDRAAIRPGHAHAHQTIAQIDDHGFDNRRNPCGDTRFLHKTLFVRARHHSIRFVRREVHRVALKT